MAISSPRAGEGGRPRRFGREKEQGPVLRPEAAALARLQRSVELEFIIHRRVGGKSFDLLASSSTNSRCLPAELCTTETPSSWASGGRSEPHREKFPNSLLIKIFHFPCVIFLCAQRGKSFLADLRRVWGFYFFIFFVYNKKLLGQIRQKTNQTYQKSRL